MINRSRADRATWSPTLVAVTIVLAIGITVLAALAPVEDVDSDPAMMLLAAQALLDHGTLRLDVYADEPAFAYRFDARNQRVRPFADGYIYYSLAAPVLSTPFVWLANRCGWHMLDQSQELALQNYISAMITGVVFLLMIALARVYTTPRASLAIALISTLGTTLISTVAGGLWTTDYQLLLICPALLLVLRRDALPSARQLALPTLLLAVAFLVRPPSAFLILALCLVLALVARPAVRRLAVAALVVGAIATTLAASNLWPALPHYYSPTKALPVNSPWLGLYGVLLSPSRGLLVYSPILLPVIAGLLLHSRRLIRHWRTGLLTLWIGLHLLAVAWREVWWGGHSFGPRLLTELIPAFVMLSAWLWSIASDLPTRSARRWRLLTTLYLLLAVPSIAIHSVQGLFNPATREWNQRPNIDRYRQLLWSWRYPQLLATEASLDARHVELQRSLATPYRLGDTIRFDSRQVVFDGWSMAESGWRWSRHGDAAIELLWPSAAQAPDAAPTAYLLEMVAGALGEQTVSVKLPDHEIGRTVLDGFEMQGRSFIIPAAAFAKPATDQGRLRVTFEAGRERTDSRPRLALRWLRWTACCDDTVLFDDGAAFASGFSSAEDGWRWTDGAQASLNLPIGELDPNDRYRLELTAGTLGHQRVEVSIGDSSPQELEFDGFEAKARALTIEPGVLEPLSLLTINFELPDATTTPNDSRQLGLAFRSLVLVAEPALVADPALLAEPGLVADPGTAGYDQLLR